MNYKAKLFCGAMAVALCLPSMLFAVDTFYVGSGGDWDVPANWSTGAVPGPDDNSFLGDFGFAFGPQVVDLASTPSSPIVGDIRLGVGPLGDGTLNQTGGDLTTDAFKWNFIGADGVNGAGAKGTYNLSGSASFAADIGVPGEIDTFDSFAGPGELHLGIGSDGSGLPGENEGTLSVSDTASFTAHRMYVGSNDGNTGTVNQSGGTVYVDDWLSIGRTGGATGTYNLSGGSLTVANDWFSIGETGAAVMGTGARSTGTVEISGNAVVEVGVRDDGGPTGGIGVGRFGARNDRPETPEVEEELAGSTGQMSILGSNASISTALLTVGFDGSNNGRFDGFFVKNDIDATLEFVADAGGVSPINVVGERAGNPDDPMGGASVWLNDGVDDPAFCADPVNPLDSCGMATLVVDLTAYASTADVTLIDVTPDGSVNGTFTGLPEGALVPGAGGRTITYMGGPDSNDIMLVGLASGVDGDFNDDGNWDCLDIDALTAAIAAGSTDLSFDMNGDDVIDLDDVTDASVGWLAVGGANNPDDTNGNPFLPGDINIDGTVDGNDFFVWNTNKFQSFDAWCSGDLTADGIVDGNDFFLWNTFKFQSSDGVQAIPEPTGLALVVSMLGCLAFRRRR